MFSKISQIFQRKAVRLGVPFLVLIVGGSFGLQKFAEIRYTFRKSDLLSKEEAAKFGLEKKAKGEVTLESEFEKIKQIDINNWENKRGPRPWETNAVTPDTKTSTN